MNFKKLIFNLFQKKLNEVSKYRNLHFGEECILIGDGVSIKWFDLKDFSDKISITVGYIPFHNDFNALNCKYCLLVEPYWFYPLVKTSTSKKNYIYNKVQLKYREIIKKYPKKQFFLNLSNLPVLRGKNINYVFFDLPQTDIVKEFYSSGINPFHGSFRASILMAIYMGFKKTYLVGFDYTHTPSRFLHWYEKGEGIIIEHEDYQKDFLKIASKYIEIITITVNEGVSNKVDYIKYKEFSNNECVYKENTEIISQDYLKALSSWPTYKL